MDEMLEKFWAPPGNHKQALFPSSGLEENLIPPFLGLNQILLLSGDGEQGGDPTLLGHHRGHPAIFALIYFLFERLTQRLCPIYPANKAFAAPSFVIRVVTQDKF